MPEREGSDARPRRRRASKLLLVLLAAAPLGVGLLASPSGAQTDSADGDKKVVVVEMAGLLDPILADFVQGRIAQASTEEGTLAIVLRVDSFRAVVDSERLGELAAAIESSPVPVTAWVGPSGARAGKETAQLLGLVDRVGLAPGAWLGETGDPVISGVSGSPWGSSAAVLRSSKVAHDEALELGIVPAPAETLGDFLLTLEDLGFETQVVETEEGQPRRTPLTDVRFVGLPYVSGLMHSVASPPVAYLLLLSSLFLVMLELYTAGVGVAGAVAAVSGVLAAYGLVTLPVNLWAVALVIFGFFAFAIDVQTGVPRLWTIIGTGSVIAGTLTLYNGVSMSWVPMLGGLVCLLLGVVGGMPPLIRSRFSTPTIGREWMIGLRGAAVEPVNPLGVVDINGTSWRAKTFRASPVPAGGVVEVTGIDGLLLEVSPASDGEASEASGESEAQ